MTVVNGEDLIYEDRPTRRSADPFADIPTESSARRVILEPGPRTPHLHPHSEEIVYVAEGRGRVWIDGVQHPVRSGSWVRIPPGTPHATLAHETLTLICFFPHESLDHNIEELDLPLEIEEEDTP